MDKARFWQLIEESRKGLVGSADEVVQAQGARLQSLLMELSPEEIRAFDEIFFEFDVQAYRYDLWEVAYFVNGGASDDGFTYFRWWLISLGQGAFEATLRDVESVGDFIEPGDEGDGQDVAYAINSAYEEKTGQEMRSGRGAHPFPPHPAGERFDWDDEDELAARYPRLAAKLTTPEDSIPFWPLLEDTYEDNIEEHAQNLKAALKELSPEEIVAFSRVFHRFDASLYSWELWAVAYLVNGGYLDESFGEIRANIIRQGRPNYNLALLAPQDAAHLFAHEGNNWRKTFLAAIFDAYEEVAHAPFPGEELDPLPPEPSGKKWQEDELPSLFPRLCAKLR